MASVKDMAEVLSHPPAQASKSAFVEIQAWLTRVLDLRRTILSSLFALQPFDSFDLDSARRLCLRLDGAIGQLLDSVEQSQILTADLGGLRAFSDSWPSTGRPVDAQLLKETFGMDEEPVGGDGNFSPSMVFAAYKYRHRDLLIRLAPHLSSLGLPMVPDALASVCVIGWIVSAEDPLVAYVSMHAMSVGLSGAKSEDLLEQTLAHFKGREGIARQAHARITRSLTSLLQDSDHETQALALADVYRRIVEGPVRQYGWTLRCLESGTWSSPPTLTPVREAMISAGGLAAQIATECVLTDLRNGEAHETLEWDGIHQRFVVNSEQIAPELVRDAVIVGLSFDLGCEAGLSFFRASRASAEAMTPKASDKSRMPAWSRAEAFFGTNGLHLVRADFNAATSRVIVTELARDDINPCFQALVCARQLLPEVRKFEIYVFGASEPALSVDSRSLDQTLPIWNQALATFDMMPFVTFLPANLDARSRWESKTLAIRSICWIAADDLLDAVDSRAAGNGDWTAEQIGVLDERLSLVKLALEQCAIGLDTTATRLNALRLAIDDVSNDLKRVLNGTLASTTLDRSPGIDRVRNFWAAWGPVARLPNISEVSSRRSETARQPGLRTEEDRNHGAFI
jgi:hypothetical protein